MTQDGWIIVIGIIAVTVIIVVVVVVSRSSKINGQVGPFGVNVDSKSKPASQNATTQIGGKVKGSIVSTTSQKGSAATGIQGDVTDSDVETPSKN